ncbi:hypothetical protein P7228_13205 [Altererythrobacter arenosus]|uniref:Peptidase inhibitor I78 family protein n=1 Tax=Altererythrobacter arenosus TaxID=3032592 RepID=A0ABY8FSR5_9SPHN|nr:hypothetical protein [Altererythrobacter sp. CAU 1644]WFL76938.1 hypothetical protein P7228_13205 [Altererythrobacter sp. CAU 1644]
MIRHALALAVTLPIGITACGEFVGREDAEAANATAGEAPAASMASAARAPIDRTIDPCQAGRATKFIGEELSQETRQELAMAVAPVSDIRWIGPGTATTEDLRPDRLNVMIDADDKIESVGCG